MHKTHIIIAPDKFKGTLSASDAARCISSAIRSLWPEARISVVPMADGGEGTAAIASGGNLLREITVPGCSPGENFTVPVFGDDSHVWIDAADCIGMKLLNKSTPDAMNRSSFGLGCALKRLIDSQRVTLCVGGTATVDGGAGMLAALGARFYDIDGVEINPTRLATLLEINRIDLSDINIELLQQNLELMIDVDVPLVGDGMSSLSFAQQKGVSPDEIPLLRNILEHYGSKLVAALSQYAISLELPLQTNGGAGGGIPYFPLMIGCRVQLGADLLSDRVLSLVREGEDTIVITGEGCYDRQSHCGKVVGTLIAKCREISVPVIVTAGRVSMDVPEIDGVTVVESSQNGMVPACMDEARSRLTEAVIEALKTFHETSRKKYY